MEDNSKAKIKKKIMKNKNGDYKMKPEPLKNKGRWANEDLCLEYAQEAVEEPKLKEHCISLWFKDETIKSAVEFYKKYMYNRKAFVRDYPQHKEWGEVGMSSLRTYHFNLLKIAFEDVIKK